MLNHFLFDSKMTKNNGKTCKMTHNRHKQREKQCKVHYHNVKYNATLMQFFNCIIFINSRVMQLSRMHHELDDTN